jgi:hypothetical protein
VQRMVCLAFIELEHGVTATFGRQVKTVHKFLIGTPRGSVRTAQRAHPTLFEKRFFCLFQKTLRRGRFFAVTQRGEFP